jgi:hypothetical protein
MQGIVKKNGIPMKLTKEIFELIFPQDIFEWFELTSGKSDKTTTRITFIEKDIPPLKIEEQDKKILARKFHNITINDFPLRGKKVLLTFRRRYWKIEGQKEYLKRDIKLTFPGTQLEKMFAVFLKGHGRGTTNFPSNNRKINIS